MREAVGDLWTYQSRPAARVDARVVTTNGFLRKDGALVMGRGVARDARDRYPGIDKRLGGFLSEYGNRCFKANVDEPWWLVTYPVKPERGPNGEPGWQAQAELRLIERSAHQLVVMADSNSWGEIVLPRPGCGNGGLLWPDVRPVIADILDDRFVVVERPV